MNKLKKQKKFRRFLKITGITAAAILIVIFILLLLGPGILKSYIKGQARDMGLAPPELKVRDFNLKKLDIRNLQLGSHLSVPFFEMDYSLPPLLKGDIKKITLSGMKLQLDYDNEKEKWTLKGLEPLFNRQEPGQENKKKGNVIVRHLTVNSSLLRVNRGGRMMMIPIELGARYRDKTKSYDFSAAVHPFGWAIFVKGNLNPDTGNGKITIHSDNLQPENFLSEAGILPELLCKSRAKFQAEVHLKGWEILRAHVKAAMEDFRVFHPLGHLQGSLNLAFNLSGKREPQGIHFKAAVKQVSFFQYNLEIGTPFTFLLKGENLAALDFDFSPFQVSGPRQLQVEGLSGTISGLPGKPRITGNYRCEIHRDFLGRMIPGLESAKPFPLKGKFNVGPGGENQATGWELSGTGRGGGGPFLSYGDMQSKCDYINLDAAASGQGEKINAAVKINIKGPLIKFGDFIFSANRILSNIEINGPHRGDFSGSGRLRILSGRLEEVNGLKAGGITIDLPWRHWLPGREKTAETGSFTVTSLAVSGFNLSRISGQIQKKNSGIEFSGTVHTSLRHLKPNLSGAVHLTPAGEGPDFFLDFSIPPTLLAENTDLAKLHPLLKGMKGSGQISGAARISSSSSPVDNGAVQGKAFIRLNNTSLVFDMEGEEEKAVVHGLEGEIKLKDLFNVVSEKRQRLTFKRINIGAFPLNDGGLTFEIESPESIFIESGEFACFNGKILINPLRYVPGSEDFKITLYCDRIDFDRLVNTLMGQEIAFGDAELNGIVPISTSGGVPVFKDGYLYSTPGIKGNIKFLDSSVVSGGVLLVEEAVKDFNYDWIKVKLYSAGKLLNVTVLIDGVPAGKLPLTLDTKTKDIIRDRSGKRRLDLKGLTLELNFKDIDLENLLKKGSKIYLNKK